MSGDEEGRHKCLRNIYNIINEISDNKMKEGSVNEIANSKLFIQPLTQAIKLLQNKVASDVFQSDALNISRKLIEISEHSTAVNLFLEPASLLSTVDMSASG